MTYKAQAAKEMLLELWFSFCCRVVLVERQQLTLTVLKLQMPFVNYFRLQILNKHVSYCLLSLLSACVYLVTFGTYGQ